MVTNSSHSHTGVKRSTRKVKVEPTLPSRADVFSEKREVTKYSVFMRVLFYIFGVACMAIIVYGLLRDDPASSDDPSDGSNEVLYQINTGNASTGSMR